MTTYIAQLGCRWNSPRIGRIWGTMIKNPNSYRFLEYALYNQDESEPASWFNFYDGDTLQFVVYDLSHSSEGAPTSWELGVSFTSLATSENAGVATSYDPTSYVNKRQGFSSPTTTSPYYLEHRDPKSKYFLWSPPTSYDSPWGACYGKSSVTLSFNFKTSCTCELSFLLSMTRASGTQTYICDPEARVTSGSTPG